MRASETQEEKKVIADSFLNDTMSVEIITPFT